MKTADGSASEVFEVNFFDGIILPRATPAWSGVMHSMSSMPRHSSQAPDFLPVLDAALVLHESGRAGTPRAARRIGLPF